MSNELSRIVKKYGILTFAALIYATGIAIFLDPNQLAPGGVTGIAIVISHVTHIPTGTVVLAINLPLMAYGLWKFGKKFFFSTFYTATISSLFINAINHQTDGLSIVTQNLLLAGIVGGVLMSLGMGIVFLQDATTGGTDIIVRALHQSHPQIKTGMFFMITDAIVITISAIAFHDVEVALYAAVSLYISSSFLDIIIYGTQEAKLLYVISSSTPQIAKKITEELDIGATFLKGSGAYSGSHKDVLLCVIRPHNYMKVRRIVRSEDRHAFLIVSQANEIFGEGYKDHFNLEA